MFDVDPKVKVEMLKRLKMKAMMKKYKKNPKGAKPP